MSDKVTRPVLRYHGGKWRLAPWVISHFPKHNVYVEPFGGAASVLLCKPPTRIEVYNDLDGAVVNLFRVLRDPDSSEQLRRAVELTPFSREEHAACWTKADDPIEDARRLIVRSFQSIGAKGSLERNGWRTRTSKAVWSPCVAWNGWPDQIPAYVRRLKDVIIERESWQRILRLYDAPDALIYADPPYPKSTRQADHRDVYVHEMTDDEHVELCRRLGSCAGMVVLSSYENDIYERELIGWSKVTIRARAQTNAPRVEVLWLNQAVLDRLQPSLLAGVGFGD